MGANEHGDVVTTWCAPPERATPAEVAAAREAFLSDPTAGTMLEGMVGPAMVLNQQRQIVAANQQLVSLTGAAADTDLVGSRPGEAVECVHAKDGPGGCGTGPVCRACGALRTILETLENRVGAAGECRISVLGEVDGGALDLFAKAAMVELHGHALVVMSCQDISAEKRRRVLERVFFHDLLNTAGGLQGLAEVLAEGADPAFEQQCKLQLRRLAEQIVDEITGQRQLLIAESGDLPVHAEDVSLADVLLDIVSAYRHHDVANGRSLVLGQVAARAIRTDVTLLRRVLGNLVKNALEATPKGGTVSVEASDLGADRVEFRVHNPAVIPEEHQRVIFQRSFSTKDGIGRGIGTYSVKLFTERHLQGDVSFTSAAPAGTTFTVRLPAVLSEA